MQSLSLSLQSAGSIVALAEYCISLLGRGEGGAGKEGQSVLSTSKWDCSELSFENEVELLAMLVLPRVEIASISISILSTWNGEEEA